MRVPKQILDDIRHGDGIALWFRNAAEINGMPGEFKGVLTEDGNDYIAFKSVRGDTLYVPYELVFISVMPPGKLAEYKERAAFDREVNAHNLKMQKAQMEAQNESLMGNAIARPPMGGFGGQMGQ